MPNDHEAPPASQKEQQDSLEEKILPSRDSQAAQFKEGGVKGWTTALGGYYRAFDALPLFSLMPGSQLPRLDMHGWVRGSNPCTHHAITTNTSLDRYANAYGVYQDNYTRLHGVSASRASWIGSVQLYFMIAGE